MITPIDVIDTTLKMGLGGIISGAVTYLVTKANHRAERAQRKSEMLESIIERVVGFDRAANHYSEGYSDWLATREPTDPKPEWLLDLAEKRFAQYQEDMKMAEAKLILLGQENCRQLLRDYGSFVNDHMTKALERDGLEKSDAMRREKRVKFYQELSRVYSRINRF